MLATKTEVMKTDKHWWQLASKFSVGEDVQ